MKNGSCGWIVSIAATKSLRKKQIYVDSLERMQAYYYRSLQNKTADTSCLLAIKYPVDSIFARLYYHHAWMKRYLLKSGEGEKADRAFFDEVKRFVMTFPDRPYFPAAYAMTRRWIEYWGNDGAYYDSGSDHKIIRSWLTWVENKSPDSLLTGIDSLETAYHFSMVKVYKTPADKYKRATELYWLYGRFQRDSMSDTTALRLADYFTCYKYPELSVRILEPYALRENPHHGILMQYIRFRYIHYEEDTAAANDYYSLLMWSKGILTHDEWCSMFVGPCNISFQVFDHEATRNLYCAECATTPNYAESPEQWEK